MSFYFNATFIKNFRKLQKEIGLIATSKRWNRKTRSGGEAIALMHSELSEGLEYLRNGNGVSNKIAPFLGIEEELSDCIIRILDYADAWNLNIIGAIDAKISYNRLRSVRHGNKKF